MHKIPVSMISPVNQTLLLRMLIRHSEFVSKTQNTCSVMGPIGADKSTVSFLRFISFQCHSLIHLLSLLIKLLELKRLKSAMIWNLVLIKFRLSAASTGNPQWRHRHDASNPQKRAAGAAGA